MQLAWPVTTTRPVPQRIGMQWIVNQAVEGRERRLGQLALGGGGGFAYLRGDRESPTEAVPLLLNTSLSA